MINQVSIFAANTKGAMHKITSTLAGSDINISALVTNDSAEYGIIRMITSDPELSQKVLTEAGYLCQLTPVVGVQISDDVGGLDKLLADVTRSNVNVDYIYISYMRDDRDVVAILHTEGAAEVELMLRGRGWTVV